ncbi:MAG: hypothetical protein BJ554DRAFT_7274, partial [Olpidium bornovanus]
MSKAETFRYSPPFAALAPLRLYHFRASSTQNTELEIATRRSSSPAVSGAVWKTRWKNGTYITSSWPSRLNATAALNMRLENTPSRKIDLLSDRQLSALNMSNRTKVVKV